MILLGPHADKEAELLLNGTKPVAMLDEAHDDWNLRTLSNAAHKGEIIGMKIPLKHIGVKCFFCKPENEPCMNAVIALFEARDRTGANCRFSAEQHRFIGESFGYNEEEITAYLLQENQITQGGDSRPFLEL